VPAFPCLCVAPINGAEVLVVTVFVNYFALPVVLVAFTDPARVLRVARANLLIEDASACLWVTSVFSTRIVVHAYLLLMHTFACARMTEIECAEVVIIAVLWDKLASSCLRIAGIVRARITVVAHDRYVETFACKVLTHIISAQIRVGTILQLVDTAKHAVTPINGAWEVIIAVRWG
jgi:hypothetical protein